MTAPQGAPPGGPRPAGGAHPAAEPAPPPPGPRSGAAGVGAPVAPPRTSSPADADLGKVGPAGLGTPTLVIVVYGTPAPQGSKHGRPIYKGKGKNKVFTGKVAQVESSAKVAPWGDSVTAAALSAMSDRPLLLERPVAVEMVFTLKRPKSRPSWWPSGERWSATMPMRPAGYPDVSKLARSTEDALTAAGVWTDDGRVVEYGRLTKVYPGEDVDALPVPGAVIRVWVMP